MFSLLDQSKDLCGRCNVLRQEAYELARATNPDIKEFSQRVENFNYNLERYLEARNELARKITQIVMPISAIIEIAIIIFLCVAMYSPISTTFSIVVKLVGVGAIINACTLGCSIHIASKIQSEINRIKSSQTSLLASLNMLKHVVKVYTDQ